MMEIKMSAKRKMLFQTTFATYTEADIIGEGGSGRIFKVVDDRELQIAIEADPWSQSVLRAAEAMTMVGARSFADLDRNTQKKVIIKCAEARALATLPLTQQPETDAQDFSRYLLGLDIVARKGHVLVPEEVDKALDMIRDYLYQQYGEY